MSNLNWVDFILLAVLLFSAFSGLSRGLVREVTSLLTWVAALIVAMTFSGRLAEVFMQNGFVQSIIAAISNSMSVNAGGAVNTIGLGFSFIVLFMGVLIIGSFIGMVLSQTVMGLSIVNRLLGALFGLGRGALGHSLHPFLPPPDQK